MSKLIGYARVSTSDQNPALQSDALKAAGVAEENIFIDHSSGAKADRPELSKCLKALQEGDTLVIWKLDRLGRSLSHLIQWIKTLGDMGVHLKSLTESIDTDTAGGELMFHVMGAFAQFERSIIVERTNEGVAAARKKGKVGGRPKKQKDDPYCLAAKKMQEDGKTVKQIQEALKASGKKVCRRTIFYWLSSPNAA